MNYFFKFEFILDILRDTMEGINENHIYNLIKSNNCDDTFETMINEDNFNINSTDESGNGFLFQAVKTNNLKIFTKLLKHPDVNVNINVLYYNDKIQLLPYILLKSNLLSDRAMSFANEFIEHKNFNINYSTSGIPEMQVLITISGTLKFLQFILNCKNINFDIFQTMLSNDMPTRLLLSSTCGIEKVKLLFNHPNIDVNKQCPISDSTPLTIVTKYKHFIEIPDLLTEVRFIIINNYNKISPDLYQSVLNIDMKITEYLAKCKKMINEQVLIEMHNIVKSDDDKKNHYDNHIIKQMARDSKMINELKIINELKTLNSLIVHKLKVNDSDEYLI